jgi:hypothetical protein
MKPALDHKSPCFFEAQRAFKLRAPQKIIFAASRLSPRQIKRPGFFEHRASQTATV